MSWKHPEKTFAMVTIMMIWLQKRWTSKATIPWGEEISEMLMVTNYSALNLLQAQFYALEMH